MINNYLGSKHLIYLILIFIFTGSCSNKIPEIDLSEKNQTVEITQTKHDPRPIFRIAVGAMISPETTKDYYEELMTLVTNKIGYQPEFTQRRTYAEVNEMVKTREVDMAYVCSGPYTEGKENFEMELLVVPVVNGKPLYTCYIITHINNNINSLEELRGKRFAFTDPNSNTGCLVPTYMLSEMNETPQSFFKDTFFTHSHDNSIKAVSMKQADGASVDGLIWEFMNKVNPEFTKNTKVIQTSDPFGIPPVVVLSTMKKDLKEKLREVFLTLHKDRRGAELLKAINIDYFELGVDSLYNSIRDMRVWLENNQ